VCVCVCVCVCVFVSVVVVGYVATKKVKWNLNEFADL
jgi:hypothetical protein